MKLSVLVMILTLALLHLTTGDEDDNVPWAILKKYGYHRVPAFYTRNRAGRSAPINLLRFGRSCVRRGTRCDHRPSDCCSDSACRCNLWGNNCRCERMG